MRRASTSTWSGRHAEAFDGAAHREQAGVVDVELVDFGDVGDADGIARRARADLGGEPARLLASSRLESSMPWMRAASPRMTAAATMGPASGPDAGLVDAGDPGDARWPEARARSRASPRDARRSALDPLAAAFGGGEERRRPTARGSSRSDVEERAVAERAGEHAPNLGQRRGRRGFRRVPRPTHHECCRLDRPPQEDAAKSCKRVRRAATSGRRLRWRQRA